jgi:hypothetical protein
MAPFKLRETVSTPRGSLPRGGFVGIGGVEFGFGERLSGRVAASLPAFTQAPADEIRRLATS